MTMLNVKQVNKQGQISIGKKYAGKKVRIDEYPDGTVVSVDAGIARIKTASDGNTSVQLDFDNDGFDAGDYIHDDDTQHLQYPEYDNITLEEGSYPIRIEYSQTSGDAYCNVRIVRYADDVEISFKHDDGTGTYVNGLVGKPYLACRR